MAVLYGAAKRSRRRRPRTAELCVRPCDEAALFSAGGVLYLGAAEVCVWGWGGEKETGCLSR